MARPSSVYLLLCCALGGSLQALRAMTPRPSGKKQRLQDRERVPAFVVAL
jgi:hypothetical protein